jgi:hypothetical protein
MEYPKDPSLLPWSRDWGEITHEHIEYIGNTCKNDFIDLNAKNLTKRQRLWRGTNGEIAQGDGWLKRSIFARVSTTETEVMCEIVSKDVHRVAILFQ